MYRVVSRVRARLADTRHLSSSERHGSVGARVRRRGALGRVVRPWSGVSYHRSLHTVSTRPGREDRRCPLALAIWTGALDGDADQRARVGDHRPAIVLPIRMFAGQRR